MHYEKRGTADDDIVLTRAISRGIFKNGINKRVPDVGDASLMSQM